MQGSLAKCKQALAWLGLFCFTTQVFGMVLNNPYPRADATQKVYYTSFTEPPKTLDPARSYSSNEFPFIAQIYEPLFEYDYLKRPYQLVPLSAAQMPEIQYLDAQMQPIASTDPLHPAIAYTRYIIKIKPGLTFQPHPAFAQDERGQYRYHHLLPNFLSAESVHTLADFSETGARSVIADDFIYGIKRLANPRNSSPIYGLMSQHIVGFKEFAEQLPLKTLPNDTFIDLRQYPLRGLTKRDDYTFEILTYGQYPQFLFWLAMPFFSPIPWEAEAFYAQHRMQDNNFTLGWYPVGSGPFMLVENNPNRRMVLVKNPNYHPAYFPSSGSAKDYQMGYLRHAGERLPLLDKIIFTLEKEATPRWNKFLQGYYDLSGVSLDSFDQAIQLNAQGNPALTASMQAKQIRLSQANESNIYYIGFNMLDPVVGGNTERARNLRLAISLAVNFEEYIAIFYNGRGQVAQGPIPPGLLGKDDDFQGMNPYLYHRVQGKLLHLPISDAKQRMKKAGYPGGIDPKTHKPLVLNYDVSMTGSPDEKAQFDWMRKQFARIGIDLNIRATQYNRFQEKMRQGNAQIFYWGWNADYPDPENFLFLLYGPNGKAHYGGENAANYHNPQFDAWFSAMRNRPNDAVRRALIEKMIQLARHDAPWIWGINTETLVLTQQWVNPLKPHAFTYNTLKYMAVDPTLRDVLRSAWNQAIFWPLGFFLLFFLLSLIPFIGSYWRQEQRGAKRVHYD